MAGIYGFAKRMYTIFNPPVAGKNDGALRIGILGAANIGPMALITPAKSHPDVIVAAVAARDVKKAEAYAKKHGIPIVHKTYDDLISDPTITAIYNPLPNGLHYEWTIKALQAGKHVLLEKPSVSNATEAKALFNHPLLSQPNAPILLEAFHYRLHPAWQTFLTMFDREDVESVLAEVYLFAGMFPVTDIRFRYSLSGGTLMDLGTYTLSAIRQVFGSDPIQVTSATYRPMPAGCDKEIDQAISATYEYPDGKQASLVADLAARGGYPLPSLTSTWPRFKGGIPKLTVRLREKDEGGKRVKRELVFNNFMGPHLWHRIDVVDSIEHIKDGDVTRTEKEVESKKIYEWPEKGEGKVGEEWWSTYRHQLEEFVNKVKARKGSGAWVDGEDSIRQMEWIDKTYEKAGLPLRPTSKALEAV